MAVAYRASANFGNAVSGTEPAGAITTGVGDLLMVFCAAKGNANLAPECTDDRYGTYELLASIPYNGSADTLSVFIRNQKTISVASTTVTVTIGAHTSVQCSLVAFSGSYAVGASAIRSSGTTANILAAATPAVTLNQITLVGNLPFCALGYNGGAAVTPPSTWAERVEVNQGGGPGVELANGAAAITTITWGNAPGVAAAYGFELDAAAVSVAYEGDAPDGYTSVDGTIASKCAGDARYAALPGSGINPVPHYYLACLDTLGVRNYWVDTSISMTNAPTPGGGATYLTATLVMLGRID